MIQEYYLTVEERRRELREINSNLETLERDWLDRRMDGEAYSERRAEYVAQRETAERDISEAYTVIRAYEGYIEELLGVLAKVRVGITSEELEQEISTAHVSIEEHMSHLSDELIAGARKAVFSPYSNANEYFEARNKVATVSEKEKTDVEKKIRKKPVSKDPVIGKKIDINTASLEQLIDLYGIGEVKARAIIAYREEHGGFKSIEELKNVRGIGEATFAKIADRITVISKKVVEGKKIEPHVVTNVRSIESLIIDIEIKIRLTEIDSLKRQIEALQETIKIITKSHATSAVDISSLLKQLEEHKLRIEKLEQEIAELREKDKKTNKKTVNNISITDIDEINIKIESKQKEKNEKEIQLQKLISKFHSIYKSINVEINADLVALRKEIEKLRNEISQLNKEIENLRQQQINIINNITISNNTNNNTNINNNLALYKLLLQYLGNGNKKKPPKPTEKPEKETNPDLYLQELLLKIMTDEDGNRIELTRRATNNIDKGKVCVTQGMINNVTEGNYIYNLSGIAKSVMGGIIGFFKKAHGKIYSALHPNRVDAYEKIKENLNNLSMDELEFLLRNYKTSEAVKNDRGLMAIDTLIVDKLLEYLDSRYNEPLRQDIVTLHAEIMDAYEKIKKLQEQLELEEDAEKQAKIQKEIAALAGQTKDKIVEIMDKRKKLDDYLNGNNSVLSLEMHKKAAKSRMNSRGHRFARPIRTTKDPEFREIEAKLERACGEALKSGDDMGVVEAFVAREVHQYKATETKLTPWGRVDWGVYNYTVYPGEVDYRDDPLMSNIITTASMITIVTAIVRNIQNSLTQQQLEANNAINANRNDQIAQADAYNANQNAINKGIENDIHATGQKLEGQADAFAKGARAVAVDQKAATANMIERQDLANSDFIPDAAYHAADKAHHAASARWDQYVRGVVAQAKQASPEQSLAMSTELLNKTTQNYHSFIGEALSAFQNYIKRGHNHDYDAVIHSLQYAQRHPNALSNMGDAMRESVAAGSQLQDVTFASYQIISFISAGSVA